MVTLDQLLEAGDRDLEHTRETGRQIAAALRGAFIRLGYYCAKLVLFLMWCLAAPLFIAGYLTSRGIIPFARWASAAFMTGYEAGIRRGTA